MKTATDKQKRIEKLKWQIKANLSRLLVWQDANEIRAWIKDYMKRR